MTSVDSRIFNLPAHEAELSLVHNEHKSIYQSAEQWLENQAAFGPVDWFVSDAERERAIAMDSIWVLQWYPSTPIGFHRLAASSLEALLEALPHS